MRLQSIGKQHNVLGEGPKLVEQFLIAQPELA